MDFSEWLTGELEDRGWTPAELSRIAGISRGTISNITSGTRQPGTDVCEAIARAFKISPEIVYRRAGLLPPEPRQDERRKELIHLNDMMNESNQEDLIAYARMRLQQQDREDKNKKNGKGNRPSKDL